MQKRMIKDRCGGLCAGSDRGRIVRGPAGGRRWRVAGAVVRGGRGQFLISSDAPKDDGTLQGIAWRG